MERSQHLQHLRILLVDDEEVVRRSISRVLSRAGHLVTTTTSLAGARAQLAIGGHVFDVVLTDLHLKDGSGLNLVREIQAHGPSPLVVVLTGDDVDCGDVRVLMKPFEKRELFEALAGTSAPAAA